MSFGPLARRRLNPNRATAGRGVPWKKHSLSLIKKGPITCVYRVIGSGVLFLLGWGLFAQAGETLYNGIVLPDGWPPKTEKLTRDPVPAPKLKVMDRKRDQSTPRRLASLSPGGDRSPAGFLAPCPYTTAEPPTVGARHPRDTRLRIPDRF